MFDDEARLKYALLIRDRRLIEHRAEWEQLARLEKFERVVRVVRARLAPNHG